MTLDSRVPVTCNLRVGIAKEKEEEYRGWGK